MKKIAILMSTIALSFAPQVSSASSPHPGSPSELPPLFIPVIGQFQAACNQGSAVCDARNVFASGHNQFVVHLETQASSTVEANVLNLLSPKLTKPITFNLVSGVGADLVLVIRYSLPHSSAIITREYGFKGQPKIFTGQFDLVSKGHGSYEIPITGHSSNNPPPSLESSDQIPAGSVVNSLFFNQGPSLNPTCAIKTNEVNNLNLNGRSVGISTTDPSASCTGDCIAE